MAKRAGRPKKDIPNEVYIGFYVTKILHFIILEKVAASGLSMSNFMREIVMQGKVMARWNPEDRELFKKLVGISTDIHRLVLIAREQNVPKAVLLFEEYRNGIDAVIKKFSHAQ